VFNRLGETNEVQSSISSRMKLVPTLDVKTDGTLEVMRRIRVITNYEASSKEKEKIKGDEQASFYPITVREADDLEDGTELAETPETLENTIGFQHGLANGKSLKHHFP